MTNIISINFQFLVSRSFHKKFDQNDLVVSKKGKFYFNIHVYVNDIGPRSRNDLNLEYSQTLMMGQSLDATYQVSWKSVRLLVPKKTNFCRVFTKYEVAAILVM